MLRFTSPERFTEHAEPRTRTSAAPSSPAPSSASRFSSDSVNGTSAKISNDAVPVYDAFQVESPNGDIAVCVESGHMAEVDRAHAAAQARQDIANSELAPQLVGVVHDHIAGRRVFARNRPSIEDLKNVVASQIERLILDKTLPAEHRSYFRELVAEQCEARSALCGQKRRSSTMKAAVSGFLSLPTAAVAGYVGARTFAPIRAVATTPHMDAPPPSYNNNRRLLDHSYYDQDSGRRTVDQYGTNSHSASLTTSAHSNVIFGFSAATMLGSSFASFSATHAFLAAMTGRQATIYRDLAASLRAATPETV